MAKNTKYPSNKTGRLKDARSPRVADTTGSAASDHKEVNMHKDSTTAKRRTITKSARFHVFHRDHFTCQYCGAQPPGVVLVVDHIHPVAAGGGNEPENLVTACEPCNQGKSDKLLSKIPIRPDADLMYLEVSQEAAELKRFREAKEQLVREQSSFAEWLAEVFEDTCGAHWRIDRTALVTLTRKHGPDIALRAVQATAARVAAGKVDTYQAVSYIFGVARSMENEVNS